MDVGASAALMFQCNHTNLSSAERPRNEPKPVTKAKIVERRDGLENKANGALDDAETDGNSLVSTTTYSDICSRSSSSNTLLYLPQWERRASQRVQYLDTSMGRQVSGSRPQSTSSPRHVTHMNLAPSAQPHFISDDSSPASSFSLLAHSTALTSPNLSTFTHTTSHTVWPSLFSPSPRTSSPSSALRSTSNLQSTPSQASTPTSIPHGKWRAWRTSYLNKHKGAQGRACDRMVSGADAADSTNIMGQQVSVHALDHAQEPDMADGVRGKSGRKALPVWYRKKNKNVPEQTADDAEQFKPAAVNSAIEPLTAARPPLPGIMESEESHMSTQWVQPLGTTPKLKPRSAKPEQNENIPDMCEMLTHTRMKKDEMELDAKLSQPMSAFEWDTEDEDPRSPISKINAIPKLKEQLKSLKVKSNSHPTTADAEHSIRSISAQLPLRNVGGSRANAFKEQAELLALSQTPSDATYTPKMAERKADFPRTSRIMNRASVLRMFDDPIWHGDSVTGYDFREHEFADGTAGTARETLLQQEATAHGTDEVVDKYAKTTKLKSSTSMPSVAAKAKKDAKRITRDDIKLSPSVFTSVDGHPSPHDLAFTISPEVSPNRTKPTKFIPKRIPVYNDSSLVLNKSSPDVSTPRSWTSEATMALPPPPPIPARHVGRKVCSTAPPQYFSPVPGIVKPEVSHSPKAANPMDSIATSRNSANRVRNTPEKTLVRTTVPYEETVAGKSPITSTAKHQQSNEIQPNHSTSNSNDTTKSKPFGRLLGKVRGAENEAILQKPAKTTKENSFTALRRMNASQPEGLARLSEDINMPSEIHDPFHVGLGISSRENIPRVRESELDFLTYYAGADGSMQHASIAVETGHNDAGSQWESILEEESDSSDYTAEETMQTFRTAQTHSALAFTCEEAVPHPLCVHKQRQPAGGPPVLKVSRDSTMAALQNSPSFSPKRDSTFIRKIQNASQLQLAKTDSHPALRNSPSSTGQFFPSSPNYFSPMISDSPLKLTTNSTPNLENVRVDSGVNLDVVNYYEEDFTPRTVGRQVQFTQGESDALSKPKTTVTDQDSEEFSVHHLRTELGMESLRLQADSIGPQHPNHPFVWTHENVMCHSMHNPQQINDPLPSNKIAEDKINMFNFDAKYFKYNTPAERGARGMKTIERCTICRSVCCLFANYLIASKTTSQEVGEAAERLKAQNMVEYFRSAYPTGIESFSTFVKCQECGNKVCPDCATRCKNDLCQLIFCKECGLGSEECPVHEEL